MRLLLDTHVWLWWNSDPGRLSQTVLDNIADPVNEVYLSAVSVWEMAIKVRIGKLPLPEPVDAYVSRRIAQDNISALPITHVHAAAVEKLPLLHNDPFDRLLIVQGRLENLDLVTADDQVLSYGGQVIHACR